MESHWEHFVGRRPGYFITLVVLVIAGGVLSGCGKAGPKLYPVTGKVLLNGKPTPGAQVVFKPTNEKPAEEIPVESPPASYAEVGADGAFSVRTEPFGEGAPAGDYAVVITWVSRDPNDPLKSTSKLPAKYADPTTSQLKATVKEGPTQLEPFDLKP